MHRCTNTYTHTYIYTYHVRTTTHKHIYTHTHTKCTYERTQSTSATMARQRLSGKPNLTPRSSALLPVRITTACRLDHIRLSALVRSRSTQFIVHASSRLVHGPPKRGHFPAILAGFCNWVTPTLVHMAESGEGDYRQTMKAPQYQVGARI